MWRVRIIRACDDPVHKRALNVEFPVMRGEEQVRDIVHFEGAAWLHNDNLSASIDRINRFNASTDVEMGIEDHTNLAVKVSKNKLKMLQGE